MKLRTIKFRAWNGREFIKDRYNHNHFISIADGKLVQVQHDDVCAEGFVYGNPEPVILQQFTGLTDINGVEVYEGDIVVVNECFTAEVKFYGCGFSVITKSVYANKDFDLTPIDAFEEVKVIGNIYQNQELLK